MMEVIISFIDSQRPHGMPVSGEHQTVVMRSALTEARDLTFQLVYLQRVAALVVQARPDLLGRVEIVETPVPMLKISIKEGYLVAARVRSQGIVQWAVGTPEGEVTATPTMEGMLDALTTWPNQ